MKAAQPRCLPTPCWPVYQLRWVSVAQGSETLFVRSVYCEHAFLFRAQQSLKFSENINFATCESPENAALQYSRFLEDNVYLQACWCLKWNSWIVDTDVSWRLNTFGHCSVKETMPSYPYRCCLHPSSHIKEQSMSRKWRPRICCTWLEWMSHERQEWKCTQRRCLCCIRCFTTEDKIR